MQRNDVDRLRSWFLAHRREMPWRESPTPYAVWVSEIMLQQTQVSVVIPFFDRWMELFPTIEALAAASPEEVIKAWEGLGYYSRARNLHEGAAYVVKHHGGVLPSTELELAKIKGIGPYTIGAILSFAFHQKKPAVDGNVLRVLSRYYSLYDDISKTSTLKKIRFLAEDLLPSEEPWVISEALIELGATVCTKKAKCLGCPLQGGCKAFSEGTVDLFPVNSLKVQITQLFRGVAVIMGEGAFLVKKGSKGKIMSDLYEFPYFEMEEIPQEIATSHLRSRVKEELSLQVEWKHALPLEKHSFTRYRATLAPHLFSIVGKPGFAPEGYEWCSMEELHKLPFSSGHRRILGHLSPKVDGSLFY